MLKSSGLENWFDKNSSLVREGGRLYKVCEKGQVGPIIKVERELGR